MTYYLKARKLAIAMFKYREEVNFVKRDMLMIPVLLALQSTIIVAAYGQKNPSQRLDEILIRNVILIDRDGKNENVVVSVLMKGNILEVVTKDALFQLKK